MSEYLFVFAHVDLNFRLPELDSVAKYFNIPIKYDIEYAKKLQNPFLFVTVPNEEAVKVLASRLVSLRFVVDCWGHADTLEECYENVNSSPAEKKKPYCKEGSTFKFLVEAFGAHYKLADKVQWMEKFDGLEVPPICDMNNPDILIWILLDVGVPPEHKESDPPSHYYFGRQIVEGKRNYEYALALNKRNYIGTTSTAAILSLFFANQGLVGPGKLVWDPCCGTASILIACGFLGASCFGSDIDWKVIHGPEPGKNIASNFKQYNISDKFLDTCLMDVSQYAYRSNIRFDAIVTDPPYGIREGSKKVHPNEESHVSQAFRESYQHATQTEKLSVGTLLQHLLLLAAERLVMGGRLVFLFPSVIATYSEDLIPTHECLKLISNSEQILTSKFSRRLITMEKIAEPTLETKSIVKSNSSYEVATQLHPVRK
eukprot:c7746_g1_i1.p1 GENE.c7746_g1_i1~~c7746_g1_i1.p1  ORF type:complete len:429 (+),score=144.24 c7746_g1_i1:35-1321(+)